MERNEDTVIVGIDNGISGGLCAISNWRGDVIAYTAMPTNTFDGKTEVDVCAVLRWLEPYCKGLVVCIEEP
jgi:hypothetical protein